jgi:hypothetical protein
LTSSFSTHRESKQKTGLRNLFERAPQTAQLSRLLLENFSGQQDIPVSAIFDWVIANTDIFLPSHARRELENLLAKGKISYKDPEGSGRSRRSGAWPDRLLVTFRDKVS